MSLYREDPKFLKLTLDQVVKDLQPSEDELVLLNREAPDWQNLYDWVDRLVLKWIESDFQRLMNALYRIDISEKKLKTKLSASETDSSELIAEMILNRELKKVVIRSEFSGFQ
jgi:hypothetical protein